MSDVARELTAVVALWPKTSFHLASSVIGCCPECPSLLACPRYRYLEETNF